LEDFKDILKAYRKTLDEENFDEAESQAFRAVQPSEVRQFPVVFRERC
jgi:hypothetical protein